MKSLSKLALALFLLASGATVAIEVAHTSEREKPAYTYVASRSREPFHRITCKWAAKISEGNRQTFQTREEAIQAGHKPCKVCKP